MNEKYTQEYYSRHYLGAYSSAKTILEHISKFLMPKSIVDFGCGTGVWLKVAKDVFNSQVLGIDLHDYNSLSMYINENEYCSHDLTGTVNLNRSFDLAISLEVAEHIDSQYADEFIKTICNHSSIVLFSAAIPMQGGTGHINEQPCTYWAEKFALLGYRAIDCIRPIIWNDDNVEIWYRNNTVLYVSDFQSYGLLDNLYMSHYPLDIIHPKMLTRIVERKTKNG